MTWSYAPAAVDALHEIKMQNSKCKIIAVEQDKRSIPYTQIKINLPVAIVVGNETYGVSKEVLDLADQIVEIPMFGVNKSLNVMISCGIILFKLMEKISLRD